MSQLAFDLPAHRRPTVAHLKPQAQTIAAHLEVHGSITGMEALRAHGIYRLSARIMEIREAGWTITTESEPHEGGTHARYVLR